MPVVVLNAGLDFERSERFKICTMNPGRQGWKMYRIKGPLVPENFLGSQKIFRIQLHF